jgi:hypothetical protein
MARSSSFRPLTLEPLLLDCSGRCWLPVSPFVCHRTGRSQHCTRNDVGESTAALASMSVSSLDVPPAASSGASNF